MPIAIRTQAVPSPRGLEHLLVMSDAATYINKAVWDLHLKYGELFTFGFGAIRFHWFVGPEALEFVFANSEALSMRRGYGFLLPIVGSTALITSDEPEHLQRRRLVQPAFHGKQVLQWTDLIELRAAEFYGSRAGKVFDLYSEVRSHILAVITELLLGREVLLRNPGFLHDVALMMDYVNLPFLAQQFKLNVPGSPWWRFVRARARVDKVMYNLISERRSASGQHGVLDMLLSARDDAGNALSDVEVRDQALSLVSAGFDTTSAALTWAMYLLLEHPSTLAALQSELASASELLKSPLLDAVVNETLRLYPTAPAGLRETRQDLLYKGMLVPAGSLLAYSIYATHRQEASFANPLVFQPARWLEAKQPATFAYLPFGYGMRHCIGARLANHIIKLHLGHILRNYAPAKAWSTAIEECGTTIHPKGGLAIRLSE